MGVRRGGAVEAVERKAVGLGLGEPEAAVGGELGVLALEEAQLVGRVGFARHVVGGGEEHQDAAGRGDVADAERLGEAGADRGGQVVVEQLTAHGRGVQAVGEQGVPGGSAAFAAEAEPVGFRPEPEPGE